LTPLALSGAIKSTAILALGRATLQDICPQVKITQSKKLLFQSVVCEGHREQNRDFHSPVFFQPQSAFLIVLFLAASGCSALLINMILYPRENDSGDQDKITAIILALRTPV
jgi:hypothetical protein